MDKRAFIYFLDSLDRKYLTFIRKQVTRRLQDIEESRRVIPPSFANGRPPSYDDALRGLLEEDWSHLFEAISDEGTDNCIYLHGHPKDPRANLPSLGVQTFGKPIYVGQGVGNRAYCFNRGRIHTEQLSKYQNEGLSKEEIVHIVRRGMSKKSALELESKLILFFGVKAAHDNNKSKRPGRFNFAKPSLLNAQYEPMPEQWLRYTS